MSADRALAALDERLDKIREASDDMRAATREGHELLKDLRRVEREVRDLITAGATNSVNAVLEEAVAKGLEGYAGAIAKARDDAVDRTQRCFDELAGILLGYERRDEDSITIELAKRVDVLGTCPRCKAPAAVRRYALEVEALDFDEQPIECEPYAILERYLCARRGQAGHYGTRVVGFATERELEDAAGFVEARRHGLTPLPTDT